MMEIELTQGFRALVDDQDFQFLNGFKWCVKKHHRGLYAHRAIRNKAGSKSTITMHRQIMPDLIQIDHKNGNGLDNRRENLRPASAVQNKRNQRKRRRVGGTSSKYKGVCWFKGTGKWHAQIGLNGKRRHLGFFVSEIAAARAYNEAAVLHHGEFAVLNEIDH